ncbi:hypothetical protein IQ07DRAFT_20528 [Pyrenochaeta sp. DS3sAY3a]|nr:hypothetical protein IQ07DRAFT_20528 [Pyrenochaeta sp. DS3sAY3a]
MGRKIFRANLNAPTRDDVGAGLTSPPPVPSTQLGVSSMLSTLSTNCVIDKQKKKRTEKCPKDLAFTSVDS